jgi:hypothetical protein
MKKLLLSSLLVLSVSNLALAEDAAHDFAPMEDALEASFAAGVDTNNSDSCTISKANIKNADALFYKAAWKLVNVNNWANLMGIPGQDFRLYNGKKQLNRAAAVGDLIRIKLPLDPTGRSYWVKIESVVKNYKTSEKKLTIVVRPTVNPFKNRKGTDITDHFFTNDATNTFSVTLKNNKIEAKVAGRDEFANTTQVATWADGAANYTISQMGWGIEIRDRDIGFQPLVWSKLNDALATCK